MTFQRINYWEAMKTAMIIDLKKGDIPLISRRRVLKVTAALGAIGLIGSSALGRHALATQHKVSWRGIALGAEAEFQVIHGSTAEAEQALDAAVSELRRLEKLFNLYDPTSLISQLNRQGRIERPPADFLSILSMAQSMTAATLGGFDVTVQGLWNGQNEGAAIGSKYLRLGTQAISFEKPGMAITLNGIAQGYITDRITAVLNEAGLKDVLVNAGEVRASGEAGPNRPWKVAVMNGIQTQEEVTHEGLAISSAYTPVQNDMRAHLFNAQSGKAVTDFKTIMVKAPNAAVADALSTGLAVMPEALWPEIIQNLNGLPIKVKAIRQDGNLVSYI